MENMKALGFPQLEASHFMFRGSVSSKQPRRDSIAKTHEIVLLCGDNLNDFDSVFEKKTNQVRSKYVDDATAKWGTHYIALPNAIYGDWDLALYGYNFSFNVRQVDSARVSDVRSY
jgi:5'-nucleotidase (lipoprotein e(P4) family)